MSNLAQDVEGALLWGYLQPVNPQRPRIDFYRSQRVYRVGRSALASFQNDCVLDDPRISNTHCMFTWDGNDGPSGRVVLEDKSANGVFVNYKKLGMDAYIGLNDGDKVAFVPFLAPKNAQDAGLDYYDFAGLASLGAKFAKLAGGAMPG